MSDLNSINYQPLQAMKGAWSKTFKSSLSGRGLLYLIAVIIGTVVLAILQAGFLIVMPGVIYLAFLGNRVTKYKNNVWQAFATANDWSFDTSTPSESLVPPSIQFGHSRTLSLVIQASVGDIICDLFTYQCTTGSGRYQQTHSFTVASIPLPVATPHFLLLSKKGGADVQRDLQDSEDLQLEGNFDDYFKLQIEKGQQIDVLTIITPDVMQALISYNQTEDIEAIDNNLYFISRNDKRDYQDMQLLIRSVVELSSQIIKNHALASAPN